MFEARRKLWAIGQQKKKREPHETGQEEVDDEITERPPFKGKEGLRSISW